MGAWPLWNPHVYGGAPHAGDIQAGFLYLPNLLLFFADPHFPYSSLQWMSIAHVWFAGAGMYLLLARGLSLRRMASARRGHRVHVLRWFSDPLRQPEPQRGAELAAVDFLGLAGCTDRLAGERG